MATNNLVFQKIPKGMPFHSLLWKKCKNIISKKHHTCIILIIPPSTLSNGKENTSQNT
jgi:hypothetical protein